MAGVGTAPSSGFFSRMVGQIPGMTNSLAQNYGGDLSGAAKQSSALFGRTPRKSQPGSPKVTNGIPKGQIPGTQMPMPTAPTGINTGPTNMSMPMGDGASAPMGGGHGMGFWNPYAPKMDPQTGQYSTPNMDMGGIFGRYNRLSGPGQTPFGMRF